MNKISLADILLPNMLRSCTKDILKSVIQYQGKVIIVGAGVAGLYAGCLLQEKGIDFSILEASDKIGGRVGISRDFSQFPIDTGAEWLHGKTSILGAMVEITNTEIFLDKTNPLYWHHGKLKNKAPKAFKKIFKSLLKSKEDISYEEFFYQESGTKEEHPFLVQMASDVGASANMISSKWEEEGYKLMSYGEDDHKFRQSYYEFINEHIAKPVANQVQFNTIVDHIDYQNQKILLTDKLENEHQADKVLITVPLTILKDGDIKFTPSLPTKKIYAFSQLGMEAGMKVFLKFSQTFAEADIIGGEICGYYVIESYKSYPGEFTIMAFINGAQAKKLSDMGEKATIKSILEELDLMLDNKASKTYLDHYIKDWLKEPFIRGAYSYPLVGSNENTRKIIAEPIEDKIFFAGEATNFNGHHQTVHGAVETAYREVISMLESI